MQRLAEALSEESLTEELELQKKTIHEELTELAMKLNINADDSSLSSLSGFSSDSGRFVMSSESSTVVRLFYPLNYSS